MLDIIGIQQDFNDHIHPENQVPMAAYMRDQFEFLGIKSQERRELSRKHIKAAKASQRIDWQGIRQLWQAEAREYQYLAVDYLRMMQAYLQPDDLSHLRELIVSKSWWDTVDNLVKPLGHLIQRNPYLFETILAWAEAEDLWLRRAAILSQLTFKEKTQTVDLEQVLASNLADEEFFIQKAIGWSLREYSKTNPSWVADYLNRHEVDLSSLARREASKYL